MKPEEIATIQSDQVKSIINGKLSKQSDRKKQEALSLIMLARLTSLEQNASK